MSKISKFMHETIVGFRIGVYYWYSVIFNYKLPMWVCCLIAILTIPINILMILIGSVYNRNYTTELADEMVEDISEKEAE